MGIEKESLPSRYLHTPGRFSYLSQALKQAEQIFNSLEDVHISFGFEGCVNLRKGSAKKSYEAVLQKREQNRELVNKMGWNLSPGLWVEDGEVCYPSEGKTTESLSEFIEEVLKRS